MKKYWIYLNERFPLPSHLPIIGIFSFSAICYSLLALDQTSFIDWHLYFVAFYLTFSIFLLLRISDEFKDHEDDMQYRKYLPVPRGLITLDQLRRVAIVIIGSQLIILFLFPQFIVMYVVVMVYMTLMFYEFFIPEWLKSNQIAYVFSHMAIIPIVDLIASAAHWASVGINPPRALIWFFLVSFFNGMVLEFGRKLRIEDTEEEGVVSYTKLYGIRGGGVLWISTLTLTLIFAFYAAYVIGSPQWVYILLIAFYAIAFIPGILFISSPSKRLTKAIEIVSGIWTIGMYLNIGACPFIVKLL